MSLQTEFHHELDRAAGLTLDATCACRAARHLPLPAPHRRLLHTAIVALEKAQQALFTARNDPWHQAPTPSPPLQLELL